jgi:2',3'-cyclic-nucleotide 2'-phosphodiesterase (5'-nucleotidase family)
MPPAPTALPKPLDLTIIHTNDTWGYLLPCG